MVRKACPCWNQCWKLVISMGAELYPVFSVNATPIFSSGLKTTVIIIKNEKHHLSQNCWPGYKICYQAIKAIFDAWIRKKIGKGLNMLWTNTSEKERGGREWKLLLKLCCWSRQTWQNKSHMYVISNLKSLTWSWSRCWLEISFVAGLNHVWVIIKY